MGSDVYVVDGKRTPFGSFGGMLADIPAASLGTTAIKGLLENLAIAPEHIDEVIIGQVLSGGCGQAPARQAMRGAGIPDAAPHPDIPVSKRRIPCLRPENLSARATCAICYLFKHCFPY